MKKYDCKSENFHFELLESFDVGQAGGFVRFFCRFGCFEGRLNRLMGQFAVRSFEIFEFLCYITAVLNQLHDLQVETVNLRKSLYLLFIQSLQNVGVYLHRLIGFDLDKEVAFELVKSGFDKLCNFVGTLDEVGKVRVFDEVVLILFLFHLAYKEELY